MTLVGRSTAGTNSRTVVAPPSSAVAARRGYCRPPRARSERGAVVPGRDREPYALAQPAVRAAQQRQVAGADRDAAELEVDARHAARSSRRGPSGSTSRRARRVPRGSRASRVEAGTRGTRGSARPARARDPRRGRPRAPPRSRRRASARRARASPSSSGSASPTAKSAGGRSQVGVERREVGIRAIVVAERTPRPGLRGHRRSGPGRPVHDARSVRS